MTRNLKESEMEDGGFVKYGSEQLPKANTMRKDKTQPNFMGVPILRDGEVGFSTAEALGNKPASCYTCTFQNKNETCKLIGPDTMVSKVIGHKDEGDPIEYWPCCSEHNYGETSQEVTFIQPLKDPDSLGLIWINAPEPGLKYGGANCGGVVGGDDCDHYVVGKVEKWDTKKGFCRVLQHEVGSGAVCSAWRDDDILSWQDAQQLLGKKRLARDLVKRD